MDERLVGSLMFNRTMSWWEGTRPGDPELRRTLVVLSAAAGRIQTCEEFGVPIRRTCRGEGDPGRGGSTARWESWSVIYRAEDHPGGVRAAHPPENWIRRRGMLARCRPSTN